MDGRPETSHQFSHALSGFVYEMRPWQWYKQALLLLGIVFSKNLLNPVAWQRVTVGIAAFCAVAGAVYVFNDINDLEEDRNHPRKCNRPIASGQIGVYSAAAFGVLLLVAGLSLSTLLGWQFLAVIVAYVAQNALYSLYLKEVLLVDVILIAVGFVLRAVAGVVAIDVSLSPWLVGCTFFAALLLAIGKRKAELEASDDPSESRSTLGEYSKTTLDQLLVIVMSTLIVSYMLYVVYRAEMSMMLTMPFALFGLFRYHHLAEHSDVVEQPVYLVFDRPFLANLLLWGVVVVGVLYRVPSALWP